MLRTHPRRRLSIPLRRDAQELTRVVPQLLLFKDSQDRQRTFLLDSRAVVLGWNFEAVPLILPPVATGAQTISIGDF